MAYDEGLAQLLRDDLAHLDAITEKKMFGGIAFMLNGNMLCGVQKDGAMFRVGKAREAEAMAVQGAGPMMFTGRKLGGMLDVTDAGMENDAARGRLIGLSLAFVSDLPPK